MTFLARWREPPPDKINDVAVYEDHAAAWWDDKDPRFQSLRAMARPRLAFLERRKVTLGGARTADVGAGGGFVSLELATRGAQVVAVDLSPRALVAAVVEGRRRELTVWPVAASAEAVPLRSGAFDLVVCTDVLPHIADRGSALDELARLAAPGGRVYVATMNRTWLARFVLITLGEDILGVVARGTHDPTTFITPGELAAELGARGLSLEAVEGVGPVGVDRRGFTFGRSLSTAVMYQALFRKR